MTQKAKQIFMGVMMAVALAAPVLSVQAATGLKVCGDPEKEKAAVQELYSLRRTDPKYGPVFNNKPGDDLYNADLQAAVAKYEQTSCKLSDIFGQIAKITNYLIGAIGIFAVFMMVNAGFTMVTNLGNESKIKEAKEGITNAILGIIIVLVAFALVNTLFQMFQVRVMGTTDVSFPLNLFK